MKNKITVTLYLVGLLLGTDSSFVWTSSNSHHESSKFEQKSQHLLIDEMFHCSHPHCQYKTTTKQNLRSHAKRIHSEEKSFLCSTCGKRFKRNDNLHRHSRNHTQEKIHFCKICKVGFGRIDRFKAHTQSMRHLATKKEMIADPESPIIIKKRTPKKRYLPSILSQEEEEDDDDEQAIPANPSRLPERQSVRLACRRLAEKVQSFNQTPESSEEDEEEEESAAPSPKEFPATHRDHDDARKLEPFDPDNMEAFELHPIFMTIAKDYPLNPGSVLG